MFKLMLKLVTWVTIVLAVASLITDCASGQLNVDWALAGAHIDVELVRAVISN